jgi:hypothetical protein
MGMEFYHGSSADGSDIRPSLGVFINPNNENEWSTAPYNKEQNLRLKEYNDWEQIYNQLDGKTLLEEYELVLQKKSNLPRRLRDILIEQAKQEGL